MEIRLEFMPVAKEKPLLRKRSQKCARAACRKRFRPTGEGRFCSDKCMHLHIGEKNRGKHRPLKGKGKPAKHYGEPIIAPLPAPQCGCGGELVFGSDSMTGVSLEYCLTCGERPLQTHGKRIPDQREMLEEALKRSVELASRPVQPRKYKPEHGNAFRDSTHKKGVAEYLKNTEDAA